MDIMNEFDIGFKSPVIARRYPGFYKMVEHLEKQPIDERNIIETGTARMKDNWEGDGQSTLIWDWYLDQRKDSWCISIDVSKDACETAKSQTKRVEFIVGHSIMVLNSLDKMRLQKTKLVYLDSFDLDISNPLPSSLHHIMELTAIWGHLPSGCLVVVDDCLNNNCGKHLMVSEFFFNIGIRPEFVGYQTGWVKA